MKKGQTALDYLITYGWAILIILVVLAVLWYYDVFNPSKWSGEYTYCGTDFNLLGASLTGAGTASGTLTMVVGNQVGNTITLNGTTIAGDVTGNATPTDTIAPGGQATITVSSIDLSSFTEGDMIDMTATISFNDDTLNYPDSEICDLKIRAAA